MASLDYLFGNIQSVQTGYIESSTSIGSGEDTRYVDIPISAVSDINRAVVSFEGGAGSDGVQAYWKSGGTNSYMVTSRLTSTTNLRISTRQTANVIAGRWKVGE